MSEQCPSCGGELTLIDVNPELALPGAGKSGLYEYRHLPNDGRCSLVVQPGVSHIRCIHCTRWVAGKRDKLGPVICLQCIEKGLDYEAFDFRTGVDADAAVYRPWEQ